MGLSKLPQKQKEDSPKKETGLYAKVMESTYTTLEFPGTVFGHVILTTISANVCVFEVLNVVETEEKLDACKDSEREHLPLTVSHN